MKRIHASAAPLRAALSALLLGACVLQVSPAFGQATANPPEQMTYQGFLVGSDGAPLGDTGPKNYDVIFKIYDHETAGLPANLLWAEQQTVTVDKGYFSILLGEGANTGDPRPALSTLFKGATASDRFVGITVKGIGAGGANVDILPRLRLMTSPYAYLATQATKLVRSDNSADLISSSGNVLSFGGHLDVLNNNSLEFGAGLTKQGDAGRMGYQLFSDGLDIVGAGTTALNRKITMFAEGGLTINGPVTATSFTGSGVGLTGVAKPTAEGHLRLGDTGLGGSVGWGSASIFSGAPGGDNTDPLWLARYNAAANSSELRMVIGDDPGSGADRFVIGTMVGGNFSQSGTWNPLYAFRANGMLEFKPGVTKEISAGTIGYQVHSGDALDIVGAGTTGSNRRIKMWAEGGLTVYGSAALSGGMTLGGGLSVNSGQQDFFPWGIRTRMEGDTSRFVDFWRHTSGFSFHMYGGNAHNSGTREVRYDGDSNWDFYSDRKLKKDIVDVEPMLDRAMKVQIRRYRWKDESEEAKHKLGVIAQEVQPLFPDLVTEITDRDTKEPLMTVGYSDFGLVAIKAIQELKVQHDAEVKDLKAQVAELKAQMKEVLSAAAELRGQADNSKVTAAVAK
jgi:hypothetical protein